jgi:hypothetical protein
MPVSSKILNELVLLSRAIECWNVHHPEPLLLILGRFRHDQSLSNSFHALGTVCSLHKCAKEQDFDIGKPVGTATDLTTAP